jgi:enoyl-CoA hydratase/carnithine racemase
MTTIRPEGSIDLEVRNGFTPKMYRELGEAYTRLDDDPSLRVGVLHAMGEHFTAGLDLPTIAPLMQRGEKAVPFEFLGTLNDE